MLSNRNYIFKFLKVLKGLIFPVLFVVSIRWSFADHYRVPTGSMTPTIAVGDQILVNKMAYDFKFPLSDKSLFKISSPKNGDIVVFKSPRDQSILLLKRLIGIPGDKIEIHNGFVKINGIFLSNPIEHYHKFQDKVPFLIQESIGDKLFQTQRIPYYAREEHISFTIPKNKYLFMGDNRDNSLDGRSFGLVDKSAIKGKAKFVLTNLTFNNFIPRILLSRTGKKLI